MGCDGSGRRKPASHGTGACVTGELTEAQRVGNRRRLVALFAVCTVVFVPCCLVFLVLTGIIAEPETVLETIVRAISGM